jgi:hypothetical protein
VCKVHRTMQGECFCYSYPLVMRLQVATCITNEEELVKCQCLDWLSSSHMIGNNCNSTAAVATTGIGT